MAIARVAQRVRHGGHFVDDETVRRRYKHGIENFFRLYRPIGTTWAICNNAAAPGDKLIASGSGTTVLECYAPELWHQLQATYDRKLHPDIDVHAVCKDRRAVDDALDRAERNARLKHKQLGVPIVVWRDGKIVEIPPEKIVVDPPSADRQGE